jgi:hypothetical protein
MKKTLLTLGIALTSLLGVAQDESGVFFGVNVGAHVANKKTAMMYSGGSNFSLYGIEWAMSHPSYKPDFDTYFEYPYEIVELPEGMTYRPSIEIGGILGYSVDNSLDLFVEANFGMLKIQDVFVVEIQNPNTNTVDYPLEQLPVFGEEQRLNINAGLRLSVFDKNGVLGYLPLFVNFNSVQVERNYFVVNNRQYNIVHNIQGITNERPGGSGYGGGSGLGIKYRMTDRIIFDASYNAHFSKVTMIKESSIQPEFSAWGLHHSILFRVLWG